MNIASRKYLFVSFMLVILYSSSVTLFGYLTTNDDTIHVCNPVFALNTTASLISKSLILFMSSITLFVYIIIIILYKKKKDGRNDDSSKILNRLKVLVVIYIFTWFVNQIFAILFLHDNGTVKWEKMLFTHNVIRFIC